MRDLERGHNPNGVKSVKGKKAAGSVISARVMAAIATLPLSSYDFSTKPTEAVSSPAIDDGALVSWRTDKISGIVRWDSKERQNKIQLTTSGFVRRAFEADALNQANPVPVDAVTPPLHVFDQLTAEQGFVPERPAPSAGDGFFVV